VHIDLDAEEVDFDDAGRVVLPPRLSEAIQAWLNENRDFSLQVDLFCKTNPNCPCGPSNKLCFCTAPDANCTYPMGERLCR
jgi:hypothetical protein